MLNRFKRFIRKYPIFSGLVIVAILALLLDVLNKDTLAHLLLIIASLVAIVPALQAVNHTLKQGFFGINLLSLTGLLFALFLKEYWAALTLALILNIDKPLKAYIRRKHRSDEKNTKPFTFTTVSHAPFVRMLDRASVPFTIMVFLIAGGVWVVTGETTRFLEIITVASTAPLLLAAPIVLLLGLSRASNAGILVKSAALFERLADTQSLIISKTGVLTDTLAKVHDVTPHGDHTKTTVLQVAAALAADSDHNLAQAINRDAAAKKLHINKAKHAREVLGMGISGRLRGQNLHIGRASFLEELGVALPSKLAYPAETVVYVAQDDVFIGSISFSETLLPGVKELLATLKRLGIQSITLLSGSTDKAVAAIAKQIGTPSYKADATAADKINVVDSAEDRPVAFVGDAFDDATVLTAADVAMTLGKPAAGLSDVAILDYTPARLAESFRISKQSLKWAWISCLISLVLTLFLIAAASSGIFTPLQSAGLQLVTLLVTVIIASSTRLMQNRP